MVEFQRFPPPSSSGPGRSPLKAKTGVRFPLGAQILKNRPTSSVGRFLSKLRFESRGKLDEFGAVSCPSFFLSGQVPVGAQIKKLIIHLDF